MSTIAIDPDKLTPDMPNYDELKALLDGNGADVIISLPAIPRRDAMPTSVQVNGMEIKHLVERVQIDCSASGKPRVLLTLAPKKGVSIRLQDAMVEEEK